MKLKTTVMRFTHIIIVSIFLLNVFACDNKSLAKTENQMSSFEFNIRKFKEFEPYMIDDIPFVDEYSNYFKNPELYVDESLELLQRKDIPDINKTIIACIAKELSLNDYLSFCEKSYQLFEALKIQEKVFTMIISNSSQGCPTPFFDKKNKDDKRIEEFLRKVISSPILSEGYKFHIKRNYWRKTPNN